jgi:hypothetical protein
MVIDVIANGCFKATRAAKDATTELRSVKSPNQRSTRLSQVFAWRLKPDGSAGILPAVIGNRPATWLLTIGRQDACAPGDVSYKIAACSGV